MLNSYFIITLIAVFSYTVISIMIYIALSNYASKKEEKKFKVLNADLGNIIENHLEITKAKGVIPKDEIKHVKGMLKDKLGFNVFSSRIIDFAKKDKLSSKEYVENYEDYLVKKFIKTDKKSIMKFAYNIYIIGEFRINSDRVNRVILDNLNSESIYVRVNSLKALSKIGDVSSFTDAIKIISLRGLYFNEKIIIDAIDSFEGDEKKLNNILIDESKNFTDEMTNIVINHFENTRYTGCRDFLLNLLKSDTSKNTVIRIARYFQFVYYDKAEDEIINLLSSPFWEVRAVAAKVVSAYNLEKCSDKLVNLVKDSNYNARYNAAMTIISSKNNEDIVEKIISGEDKYARDIVIYALFTNNQITYEKYVGLLGEKEEKAKGEAALTMERELEGGE